MVSISILPKPCNVTILAGKFPVKVLFANHNVSSFVNADMIGIFPPSLFKLSLNCRRELARPSILSWSIVPDNSFLSKSKICNSFRLPICLGKFPLIELENNSIAINESIAPISFGKLPFKLFCSGI